jgi:hypothetical protein
MCCCENGLQVTEQIHTVVSTEPWSYCVLNARMACHATADREDRTVINKIQLQGRVP